MGKVSNRLIHASSNRLQATFGQKQSMLLQWRQYESKIATRSAEQSESLKKSALLSKSAQKADTPTQVLVPTLLSVICTKLYVKPAHCLSARVPCLAVQQSLLLCR